MSIINKIMIKFKKCIILDDDMDDCLSVAPEQQVRRGFLCLTKSGSFINVPRGVFEDIKELGYSADTKDFNKILMNPEDSSDELFHTIVQLYHYVALDNVNLVDEKDLTEEAKRIRNKINIFTVIPKEEAISIIKEDLLPSIEQPTKDEVNLFSDLFSDDNFSISVDKIKSFELKACYIEKKECYDQTDATTLLRLVVYKLTGSTLLINNDNAVSSIKSSLCFVYLYRNFVIKCFEGREKDLAEIFNRYKKIFLAMKCGGKVNSVINKIGHLSKKYHNPLPANAAIHYAEACKNNDIKRMLEIIKNCNYSQLVRLFTYAYTDFSATDTNLYSIRNGKVYYKKRENFCNKRIELIIAELIKRTPHKKYILPTRISYGLPISGKNFIGNYPNGSYITIDPEKFHIVGIHWTNTLKSRVDLDLSIKTKNDTYNWCNTRVDNVVNFSGDVTDAPARQGGAAEAFFFNPGAATGGNDYFLSVYNFTRTDDAKCDIFLEESDKESKKLAYHPSKQLVEPISFKVESDRPECFGIFSENRLYLTKGSFSKGNVMDGGNADYLNAFSEKLKSAPTLYSFFTLLNLPVILLDKADEVPEEFRDAIDLRDPAKLTKEDFLKITRGE